MGDRTDQATGTIRYRGPERCSDVPMLGMRISDFDAEGCARHMLEHRRSAQDGVGLFVTPNIQHVAAARADPEFAAAMADAQLAVCDGFPVYRYARSLGHSLPGRVTGREVIDRMFAEPGRLAGHRLFFLIDGNATGDAVAGWIARQAPDVAIEMVVPPFGFDADPAYCRDIAQRIAAFEPTLLFLCVGAPRSELFVHRQRAILPPCWALCIGQSFRLMLGMHAPPPPMIVRANLEWAWRILLEPRRMLARYGPAAAGFAAAVLSDRRARRRAVTLS